MFRHEYNGIPKQNIHVASLFEEQGLHTVLAFGNHIPINPQTKDILATSATWSKQQRIWTNDKGRRT